MTQARLFLDHDVSRVAAEALRDDGFDVIAASEVGREAAADEEQLEFSASQGRVLVSFNVRDYPAIHLRWLDEGRKHAGILLSKQMSVRETIRALKRVLTTRTAEELENQMLWL
jgi:predicted nuclease of predicted toxin-antitoxin system